MSWLHISIMVLVILYVLSFNQINGLTINYLFFLWNVSTNCGPFGQYIIMFRLMLVFSSPKTKCQFLIMYHRRDWHHVFIYLQFKCTFDSFDAWLTYHSLQIRTVAYRMIWIFVTWGVDCDLKHAFEICKLHWYKSAAHLYALGIGSVPECLQ